MKIKILFEFHEGPYGGGNQFLRGLSKAFSSLGVLTDSVNHADVILMNGNPQSCGMYASALYTLRYQKPNVAFLLRLDGPISLIRGRDAFFDRLLKELTCDIMDGVIYQSEWSKAHNESLFAFAPKISTLIHNASDDTIFWRKAPGLAHNPIRLIATSWSPNMQKGFDIYRYLDEHLDFSRYSMSFVGNTPLPFRNIHHIPPLDSTKLAEILREHDIYITASQKDPCSNSLIEALSCGLPSVALREGGHPELVIQGGELFDGPENVIEAIDSVTTNLAGFQNNLPIFSLSSTARAYCDFCELVVCQRTARQNSRMSLFLKSKVLSARLELYRFYSLMGHKLKH